MISRAHGEDPPVELPADTPGDRLPAISWPLLKRHLAKSMAKSSLIFMAAEREAIDTCRKSNYSIYMKTKVIKIGNSRGIRLPRMVLDLYGLDEGAELEIEQQPKGIFLQVKEQPSSLSRYDAYRQMASEQEESLEWSDWDAASGDGLDD